MAKRHGQAAMEYILIVGVVMLIFMVVLFIVYEKNAEIVQTKIFLDAKMVTKSIVTNINTISMQGDGYYKYFTLPPTLYGGTDYWVVIHRTTVELKWESPPYTWSESVLTADSKGYVIKGLNKVVNCGGVIYIGSSTISCEEIGLNLPPVVNISYPSSGAVLNCTTIIINGTASDVNGTVMEVKVRIDEGFWNDASVANQSNETTWTYSWAPESDGSHTISVEALDEYSATDIEAIDVTILKCSDLVNVSNFNTFVKPSDSVETGTNETVSIDVKNLGVGRCGSFKVKLEINKVGGGYNWSYEETISSGLGAGQKVTVSDTWAVPYDVANYIFDVTIDYENTVNETDETNNNYSTTINAVTDPPISNITYPSNDDSFDYYVIKDGLNITGTASDDNWVVKVEVSINGTWYNATGNETWNYSWIPPKADGNYTICSKATDNNNYEQVSDTCINITVYLPCYIILVPGSVWQDHPVYVRFEINNTGTFTQTIDKMNATWNLSGVELRKVNIPQSSNLWSGSAANGTEIDIDDAAISVGTETVSLRFDSDMEGSNIAVTFILNDSTICSPINLSPQGAVEVCGNCIDEDVDGLPDWNDTNCTQYFRDEGCGEVHYCNPDDSDDNCDGDVGDCGKCDDNFALIPELSDNDAVACNSYGYSTAEWHFYKIIPDINGTLTVNFTGNPDLGITSSEGTDIAFYDYGASTCSRTYYESDLEASQPYTHDFGVTAGTTYIIALDVDACINDCGDCTCGYWPACNCTKAGSYNLTTAISIS